MRLRRGRIHILGVVVVVAVCAVMLLFALGVPRRPGSLPKAQLADGRILQVEGVSFGTYHQIGRKSLVEKIGPWLPSKLSDWFSPKYPYSEFHLDRPGLVIWVNATDPLTGNHVDCQGIRVEIVGESGDLFAQETSSWFGGMKFWRVGHIFYAFPREERALTVRVTPWRTNLSATFKVPNPCIAHPAAWSGRPLPQHQQVGDLDITLTRLLLQTNGTARNYWQTTVLYWLPVWELHRAGQPAGDWDEPEWIAEDSAGNRSRYVGVHHPALRFSAKFYPNATNLQASQLLGSSPLIDVSGLQSNTWWNLELKYQQHAISVLGLFTNGTHIFSDGVYQTNPAIKMGPVRGGAPSGWVGQSQRVTPTRVKRWEGHYTPVPVIYCLAPGFGPAERLAVRLRDDQGRYWLVRPESQGNNQGIKPFLIDIPPGVKTIVAEFVVLRPVEAEFLVKVPPLP